MIPLDRDISLADYQWKNRLILIFTPSESDSTYQDASRQIVNLNAQIIERDIVVFNIIENSAGSAGDSLLSQNASQELRENFHVESGSFVLILIGKDGGEKLRQENDFNFDTIFRRIDAMPMRQSEMRQRKKTK